MVAAVQAASSSTSTVMIQPVTAAALGPVVAPTRPAAGSPPSTPGRLLNRLRLAGQAQPWPVNRLASARPIWMPRVPASSSTTATPAGISHVYG